MRHATAMCLQSLKQVGSSKQDIQICQAESWEYSAGIESTVDSIVLFAKAEYNRLELATLRV